MAQVGVAGELHGAVLDPPPAFDEHRPRTVDHDLVDLRVGEQRLEGAEPEGALGDPAREFGPGTGVQHRRLAVDERTDPRVEVAGVGTGLLDQALAQCVGERVEGIFIHALLRAWATEVRPLRRAGAVPRDTVFAVPDPHAGGLPAVGDADLAAGDLVRVREGRPVGDVLRARPRVRVGQARVERVDGVRHGAVVAGIRPAVPAREAREDEAGPLRGVVAPRRVVLAVLGPVREVVGVLVVQAVEASVAVDIAVDRVQVGEVPQRVLGLVGEDLDPPGRLHPPVGLRPVVQAVVVGVLLVVFDGARRVDVAEAQVAEVRRHDRVPARRRVGLQRRQVRELVRARAAGGLGAVAVEQLVTVGHRLERAAEGVPELVLLLGAQAVTVEVQAVVHLQAVREGALARVRHGTLVEILGREVLPAVAHRVAVGVGRAGVQRVGKLELLDVREEVAVEIAVRVGAGADLGAGVDVDVGLGLGPDGELVGRVLLAEPLRADAQAELREEGVAVQRGKLGRQRLRNDDLQHRLRGDRGLHEDGLLAVALEDHRRAALADEVVLAADRERLTHAGAVGRDLGDARKDRGRLLPNKQGTSATHGAALGAEEVAAARETLGWRHAAFDIPVEVADEWRAAG
ncbi:MAG: hypothetical protein ACEQSX_17675, partial [Baekduiaceae bacterium]